MAQRQKKRRAGAMLTANGMSAEGYIDAARVRLASRVPYFNQFTFRLRPTPKPGIGTMSVDAKLNMYYDPKTVVEWWNTSCEVAGHQPGCLVVGVMYHETNHVVRDHHGRFKGLDHRKANIAGDAEINDDVIEAGFCLPKGCVLPSTLGMKDGLLAEEYYAGIEGKPEDPRKDDDTCTNEKQGDAEKTEEDKDETEDGTEGGDEEGDEKTEGDGSGGDEGEDEAEGNGDGDAEGEGEGEGQGGAGSQTDAADGLPGGGTCGGCAGNPQEWETGNEDFDDISDAEVEVIRSGVAQNIKEHEQKKGRGSVPGNLSVWADEHLAPPKVDWRKLFAKFLRRSKADQAGMVDYSRKALSRTYWGTRHVLGKSTPLRPGLRQPVPEVSVVVDTSASMFGAPLDYAMAEVMGIVKSTGTEVNVWACDTAVQASGVVRSAAQLSELAVGGGGTKMTVGVKAAIASSAEIVVLITDGYTDWPSRRDLKSKSFIVVLVGEGAAKPPAEMNWPTVEVDEQGARKA